MTANQVKGKGFRGALRYNLQKVNQGVAQVLDSSFAKMEENAVMKELQLVRMLRPNLGKYFYHTSLNFPPNEDLGDEQMNKIANEYLNNMGFVQNQYIIFRHFDADHPHLHLLVNRIGYDGSVVSDSKDYQRSEQVLRKLEKHYGLTEVISSRQAKERAMTKNELEMMKRTDAPSTKMKLQVILKSILQKQPSVSQFVSQLEGKGVNVLFNEASTGFVSGISYGYEGLQFKGTHLGNAYKWQAIKTQTCYEQERDRAAIHAANIRTREQQTATTRQSATRTTARGINSDTKAAAGNRKNVQQCAGKLQDKFAKADQQNRIAATGTRSGSGETNLSAATDAQTGRKHQQNKQQGGQQPRHQTLRGNDLIGSLLGPVYDGSDMVPKELRQNKRKGKKKRGLSL